MLLRRTASTTAPFQTIYGVPRSSWDEMPDRFKSTKTIVRHRLPVRWTAAARAGAGGGVLIPMNLPWRTFVIGTPSQQMRDDATCTGTSMEGFDRQPR